MYHIMVFVREWPHTESKGKWLFETSKSFKFGEWQEIGFWLNDSELIGENTKIEITMSEGT